MTILSAIKHHIGKQICRRNALNSNIKREAINFQQAKKIGILYDASNLEEFNIIKNYAKQIRALKKEVKALGFVNGKDLDYTQQPTIDLDFFTIKNTNWYYKPFGIIIDNFVNEKYDILICLDMACHLPVQHILAGSKAKFRVGRYNKDEHIFFDFMIDLQNINNIPYFIEQVNHYINLINK